MPGEAEISVSIDNVAMADADLREVERELTTALQPDWDSTKPEVATAGDAVRAAERHLAASIVVARDAGAEWTTIQEMLGFTATEAEVIDRLSGASQVWNVA